MTGWVYVRSLSVECVDECVDDDAGWMSCWVVECSWGEGGHLICNEMGAKHLKVVVISCFQTHNCCDYRRVVH